MRKWLIIAWLAIVTIMTGYLFIAPMTADYVTLTPWSAYQTLTAARLNAEFEALDTGLDTLAADVGDTSAVLRALITLRATLAILSDSTSAWFARDVLIQRRSSVRDSANAAITANITHMLRTNFIDSLNVYASTYGKTLMDDAAATNARATLELGTMATQTATSYVTGAAWRDSLNAIVDYRNMADSTATCNDQPKLLQAGAAVKFGETVYQNWGSKKLYPAQGDSLRSCQGLYMVILRGGGAADAWVTVSKDCTVKFTPWTGVTTDSTDVFLSVTTPGAPVMARTTTSATWAVKIGNAITTDVLEFKPNEIQLLIP